MSKLADRIRKATRVEAAPIGFTAVRPQKNAQLLVAVQLDSDGSDKIPKAVEKGAGAIILKGASADDIKSACEAAGEVPLGAWPGEVDAETAAALVEAGADFLVFNAESTPACALLEEKLGYVLTLRSGEDENYLRVLESVQLDAVLIEDYSGPLTLQRQVELRLAAALTRKPLMLPVRLPIESGELQCLRDAGATVLAVDGGDSQNLDGLPAIIQAIEALPGPRRRRETSLEVLLPRAAELAAAEEEEEGEEE